MNKTLTRLALLLLSLVILPQPAFAPPPPPTKHGSLQALQTCLGRDFGQLYAADSADLPAALAVFAGKGPRLAFRVCSDFDDNTHYFMRIAAAPDLPVCEITESEIFPDPEGKLRVLFPRGIYLVYGDTDTGWSAAAPKDWRERGYYAGGYVADTTLAQEKQKTCPPPTDTNFARLQNMPPGIFKAIIAALREAPKANPSLFRPARADPARFLHVRPVSAGCSDRGCYAALNNNYTATFDIVDGKMMVTQIDQYID